MDKGNEVYYSDTNDTRNPKFQTSYSAQRSNIFTGNAQPHSQKIDQSN